MPWQTPLSLLPRVSSFASSIHLTMCVCVFPIFFVVKPFGSKLGYRDSSPLNISAFPKSEDIVLYNYDPVITFWTVSLNVQKVSFIASF